MLLQLSAAKGLQARPHTTCVGTLSRLSAAACPATRSNMPCAGILSRLRRPLHTTRCAADHCLETAIFAAIFSRWTPWRDGKGLLWASGVRDGRCRGRVAHARTPLRWRCPGCRLHVNLACCADGRGRGCCCWCCRRDSRRAVGGWLQPFPPRL